MFFPFARALPDAAPRVAGRDDSVQQGPISVPAQVTPELCGVSYVGLGQDRTRSHGGIAVPIAADSQREWQSRLAAAGRAEGGAGGAAAAGGHGGHGGRTRPAARGPRSARKAQQPRGNWHEKVSGHRRGLAGPGVDAGVVTAAWRSQSMARGGNG